MTQERFSDKFLFPAVKLGKAGAEYYICSSNRIETMNIAKLSECLYQSPAVRIIEIDSEGVLCASGDPAEMTESLDEILGEW